MKIIVFSTALLLVVAGLVPVYAEISSTRLTKAAPMIILADAGSQKAKSGRSCPTVEIFVTSWCGYCKMMEKDLDKEGIAYTTYDVEKDDNAAKIYRELHGRGVPLVRVGSKVVFGYDPKTVISYANGK
jgi:glutaredoxin